MQVFPKAKLRSATTPGMKVCVLLCGRDVVGQRGLVAGDAFAADHADAAADGVGHHAGVDGGHAQWGRLRDRRRTEVRLRCLHFLFQTVVK